MFIVAVPIAALAFLATWLIPQVELKSWSAPTPAEAVEEAIGDVWPTEVLESGVADSAVARGAARPARPRGTAARSHWRPSTLIPDPAS